MLDLSQPSRLWTTAETLLKAARERLDTVVKLASKQNRDLPNQIMSSAWKRIGGKERAVSGCDVTLQLCVLSMTE